MTQVVHIGDEIDFDGNIDNSVSISFLPLDFFDHWERGSMLANFVADYFHHNFPDQAAHNLISTVLNELVENSVKFSRNNSTPVNLVVRKRSGSLLMKMENCIPRHRKPEFVDSCQELFDRNLDELYVDRIQKNLTDTHASGIGLILIRKDYCTALSFEFIEDGECPTAVAVTVELDFEESGNPV